MLYRLRLPHGDGLLVYFTDDPRGRYNYSGEFEQGEISPQGGGTTFYRNGDSYEGDYSRQGDAKGLPEGRGTFRQVIILLLHPILLYKCYIYI